MNKDASSHQLPLMKRTAFPFVVTLLLAFIAWAATHAIDRLTKLPLIKYTQTMKVEQDNSQLLTFEFENITSNINFADIEIRILFVSSNGKFLNPVTTVVGPGWDADTHLFSDGSAIRLTIPNFHPEWKLRLSTNLIGADIPRVQLEKSTVPTILEPASWRTILIEYEIVIITLFAFMALVFFVLWARNQ